MSPTSVLTGAPNAYAIAIFLCFYLLPATRAELVASSQHPVTIGQTFHALCHYEIRDVDRFLYWTIYYHHGEDGGQEFKSNVGGIDLTTCSPFSFDASNAVLALKTGLHGLTGQITCGLHGGPMELHINKVRPEYDGLRFSCNSGRSDTARSNVVTLIVGSQNLVTLETEESGVGTALRATCRVDKSLNPMFLYWATGNIDDTKDKSTFGGMVVEFCYRYKVRGFFHSRVNFNCLRTPGTSSVSSTLVIKSLPVGTAIFCYVMINNSDDAAASRIESNWLTISSIGRFTKLSISAKSSSVPINGKFYAKCRLLSREYYDDDDRIMWHGISKFGKRAHINYSKDKKEGTLLISPIYSTDNQSQILCGIIGGPATQIERMTIEVMGKAPVSLEIIRNSSTIEPVPINGLFRAVCSFRNIVTQAVHWVATEAHLVVGRVNISRDACRPYIMITNTVTTDRLQLSCNMTSKTTTFSVHPVNGDDAGAGIYCTAVDQYGLTVRSDSLFITTQADRASSNIGVIVKKRPTYREATLAVTCPSGNTAFVFLVKGADDSGSELVETRNKTFILVDRNCSVIDNALYLPWRFFIDCEPGTKSLTVIIDPVYSNISNDYRMMCGWYDSSPTSKPERKMFGLKRQIPRVVYPVSKPALKYSGGMIRLIDNNIGPDIWTSVWLIPATPDQEMEFSCTAGSSMSSSFNLSIHIQTDKGFSFQLHSGIKKPNGTTQTFNIRQRFRMESSYIGAYCVAENIVSRWESDLATILLRNTSVFMELDGWLPSNSSFFERRVIPNLELCYTLCDFRPDCQGVSYHSNLCSLSNSSWQDSQFLPKEGFSFHDRLLQEDVLQRNNFWPDVYNKHENRTLLHADLDRRTKLSATQCQKECSKLLPCRSIQFERVNNICYLSSLGSVEIEEKSILNRYNWDVYTRNDTPSSFIAIRGVFPDVDLKPVIKMYLSNTVDFEDQSMLIADTCRGRNDCVSFVCAVEEDVHLRVCSMYNVNIHKIRLVEHIDSKFESYFYVRVRSVNTTLVPVNPHKLIRIS